MAKQKKRKGFSRESIAKVIRLMYEYIAIYEAMFVENIKICISKGNKKIGRVMNVSLPPLISCGNFSKCMFWCYDIKACLQYPHIVIDARIRNWTILQKDRDRFFRLIDEAISRRKKNKCFRWHVSGDIVDLDYLDRMVKIAVDHPDWIFWTYTKMYALVNEYCDTHGGREAIPSNLSIMFSEWRGLEMNNPYHFAEFKVHFEDEPEPDCHKCPGNCDVCLKLHRGCPYQETTYNDVH